MDTKTCTKCKEAKPLDGFNGGSGTYKKHAYCRACCREYERDNRDRLVKHKHEYYKKNREKITERRKSHSLNTELRRSRSIRCYHRNAQKPAFRVCASMRTGMWQCLKKLRKKNDRTFSYIDKSPEELMDYLESQFTEGMTRYNYGEWHVDHIRPLASFDFTGEDMEEKLKEAWNYTNLQPLWASDNMSKGDKWDG